MEAAAAAGDSATGTAPVPVTEDAIVASAPAEVAAEAGPPTEQPSSPVAAGDADTAAAPAAEAPQSPMLAAGDKEAEVLPEAVPPTAAPPAPGSQSVEDLPDNWLGLSAPAVTALAIGTIPPTMDLPLVDAAPVPSGTVGNPRRDNLSARDLALAHTAHWLIQMADNTRDGRAARVLSGTGGGGAGSSDAVWGVWPL